jgi:DHA2 family multidrug resistance protein-like MFS transporter
MLQRNMTDSGDEVTRTSDGMPVPRRHLAMAAIAMGTALAVIDASIVSVALPTLARDLGVAASSAVLVVTAYQLTLVMTLLPLSALGGRIGLTRLYRYGQSLFLLSTVLCFFARSLPFLLVLRVLQALGAAASLSVSSALIRAIYPARHLGRGLAVNNVVVSSSGALAPTLGGLVLSVASWPWIFAAASPLALLSLWLGRRALPSIAPAHGSYDVTAAALCAATFGLVIAGLETLAHGTPAGGMARGAAVMLPAGVAVGVLFVRRELKSPLPILPVDLLARPVVALSTLGGLLAFVASMTMILSLPFRLQREYGFSPGAVGSIITPWPLGMMVVAPLAGVFSDRYPAGLLGGIGMGIASVGLLSFAFLPAHLGSMDLIWRMALCGMAFGLFLAPNARVIIHSAPPGRAASAGGLISTTRLTGQTLGATLIAALLSMGLGGGRAPACAAASLAALAGVLSVSRLWFRRSG